MSGQLYTQHFIEVILFHVTPPLHITDLLVVIFGLDVSPERGPTWICPLLPADTLSRGAYPLHSLWNYVTGIVVSVHYTIFSLVAEEKLSYIIIRHCYDCVVRNCIEYVIE